MKMLLATIAILGLFANLVNAQSLSGEWPEAGGNISVTAAGDVVAAGLDFTSDGGLVPVDGTDAAPFTFFLSNTENQVTYGNLGSNVTFADGSTTMLSVGAKAGATVAASWGKGAEPVAFPVAQAAPVAPPVAATPGGNIGFNFSADREDAAVGATEMAGVVPQAYWNNWDGVPSSVEVASTGSTATAASPNAGAITDSDGDVLDGVSVNWEAWNAWNTDNGVSNGDNKLMNGYLDNNADNPTVTFSVSGLPADIADAGYDVIAYFGSDGNGRTGTVTDGTSTYSYSTFSQQGATFPEAYVRTTDTADGNPEANYAVFSGLSGADFTLMLNRGSNNSGLHAIQVVSPSVPEPGTHLMLVMGLLGILGFMRRRR